MHKTPLQKLLKRAKQQKNEQKKPKTIYTAKAGSKRLVNLRSFVFETRGPPTLNRKTPRLPKTQNPTYTVVERVDTLNMKQEVVRIRGTATIPRAHCTSALRGKCSCLRENATAASTEETWMTETCIYGEKTDPRAVKSKGR